MRPAAGARSRRGTPWPATLRCAPVGVATVVTVVAAACAGAGGDTQPAGPVARAPGLTGAAVTPGATEVPLDSAVALRVDPTWSTAATPPSITVAWTRRGSAAGVVTADVGDGRNAAYRAGGVGTDTIEATVTATTDGGSSAASAVTARAVVIVRGPRVARLAFPARMAYVGVGGTIALPAVGRDAAGATVTKAVVTYRVLASGGANGGGAVSVAGDGTLTGQSAGAARVVAEASTVAAPGTALPADTLRVVVAGDAATLALGLADTVAQTGRSVTVLGPGAGATATLDGQALAVSGIAGGAALTPPAALFAACRPLGATAPLVVTSGGRMRTLPLAVYAPQLVSLAAGQYQQVTTAAAGGCPITVDQAGDYVVMPFAWDRALATGGTAGGSGTGGATTALQVAAGADASGFAPNRVPTNARAVAFARAGLRSIVSAPPIPASSAFRSDVLLLHPTARASQSTGSVRSAGFPASWSGGACPIPTAVGDAMPVGTLRDATGRFLQTASMNGGGGTSEPWTLAAITPSVAVFYDSALVHAKGGIPGADTRAQAFAAAYDSTVTPLLESVTEGVPDADGNGRVVVLVALHAGSAYAMPTGYGRPDCEANGFVLGEAINLGGDAFVAADNLVGPAVSVAAHETGHVVDNAQRYMQAPYQPSIRQDTWWSREGYAVLMQYLWSLGKNTPADALTGNRSVAAMRTIYGTPVGGFCERPDRAILATWYQLSAAGYPLACQAVRYALGQVAVASPGTSVHDLMVRWSTLRDRRHFVDAMNGLGAITGTASSVTGAWYLSWVADGVAGTVPALQDPAADLRSLYRTFFPQTPYPATATTLAIGNAITATLGEPDALHVQVTLPARGWVAVTNNTGSAGIPTDRADVMVFRVR